MLLIVSRDAPGIIYATHEDYQVSEVDQAYAADQFGILQSTARFSPDDAVPDTGGCTILRAIPVDPEVAA